MQSGVTVMRKNLLSDFVFLNIKFDRYHYTDNRVGVELNYIAYMLKGRAKIVSDAKCIDVEAGDVFFIPKNLGYQSYWYGEDDVEFLSCGFYSLHTVEDMDFELQLVSCDDATKQEIVNVFKNGGTADCEVLSHFYRAMSMIIPKLACRNESKETAVANKIKACIEKNPYKSLREIAKLANVNEAYMYEVFRTATGITPNDYKQKVLCEKGIGLLLTTDKKVEEIASLTNFSSASYFRKVLKKHTGSTPREIRKNRGF